MALTEQVNGDRKAGVEALLEKIAARGAPPIADTSEVLCLRDEAGNRLPREAPTRLGYSIRFYPIWMRVWLSLDEPEHEQVRDWPLADKARVIWHCMLQPNPRERAEAAGVTSPEEFAEWLLDNADPMEVDGWFGPIIQWSGSRLNRWQLEQGEEGSDGEPGKVLPAPSRAGSSSASSTAADTGTPDPEISTT